jgi:hypothetical protein
MGRSTLAWQAARRLAPVVVAIWCVSGCGSPQRPVSGRTQPAPSSTATLAAAQILAQINYLAAGNGEPNPTDIQYVSTTGADAAKALSEAPPPGPAGAESVILVAARGRFTGYGAKIPPGAALPTGTVITAVMDAASGALTEWGISRTFPQLATLGPVVKL